MLVQQAAPSSSGSSAGNAVEQALLAGGLMQQEVQQLQAEAPEAYEALQCDPEGPALAKLLAVVQRGRDGMGAYTRGRPSVPLSEVCCRLVDLRVSGGLTPAELAVLLKKWHVPNSLPGVLVPTAETASLAIEVLQQQLSNLFCKLGRALHISPTLLSQQIGACLNQLKRYGFTPELLDERVSAFSVLGLVRSKPTAFTYDLTTPYHQETIRSFCALFGETPKKFMLRHPTYAFRSLGVIECRATFMQAAGPPHAGNPSYVKLGEERFEGFLSELGLDTAAYYRHCAQWERSPGAQEVERLKAESERLERGWEATAEGELEDQSE
eukprot:scaffold36.g5070.t1